MKIPDRVNANWISTLGDKDLLLAERKLHADFQVHEKSEKARSGARYMLLNGPSPLVNAWLRWLLVSNATRARGLVTTHTRALKA